MVVNCENDQLIITTQKLKDEDKTNTLTRISLYFVSFSKRSLQYLIKMQTSFAERNEV